MDVLILNSKLIAKYDSAYFCHWEQFKENVQPIPLNKQYNP